MSPRFVTPAVVVAAVLIGSASAVVIARDASASSHRAAPAVAGPSAPSAPVPSPTASAPLTTTAPSASPANPSPSTAAARPAAGSAQAEITHDTVTPPKPVVAPNVGTGPGVTAAAAYAQADGFTAGVAVEDTKTGQVWAAGDGGMFSSESVMKVFIATRILLQGDMSGSTETTAYDMITESDDDAADDLYGLAGGDDVEPWIAAHYGIADLGGPPLQPGWWGGTQVTAVGLVEFYTAVKADPVVWPWLSAAMAATTEDGSDGTYQFFGLKQADPAAATKQGWGDDSGSQYADFNSTGYVSGDRYAVAILVQGPVDTYDSGAPDMDTSIAKMIMPGGVMTP